MPGIVIQIQGDGENVEAALRAVRGEMESVRSSTKEAGGAMSEFGERARTALEYAGIYLGLREIKEGMRELVAGSMELAESIEHLSQQTGISAQNLSVLKFAAESNGISFDLMVAGFRKLSQAMVKSESDNKASEQAFQRLGISQAEVRDHTNDLWGMLEILANKFKEMPDGALKSAEATTLLGKAGSQLIPILNEGAAGLEEYRAKAEALGIVLDEQGIAKMEEMKRGLAELKGAAEGAGLGFTEALAPGVAGAANALALATGGTNAWTIAGKGAGLTALELALAMDIILRALEGVGEAAYAVGGVVTEVAGGIMAVIPGMESTAERAIEAGAGMLAKSLAMTQQHNADMQKVVASLRQAWDETLAPPKSAKIEGVGSAIPDITGTAKKTPGTDGIDKARTALADAMAAEQVAAVKGATEAALAALEEQHKQFLISDDTYYKDKLKLQNQAFDAQLAALKQEQEQLTALEQRQQSDKKLKRDKTGQSAEELATARQLVELQGKIAEAEGQKARAAEQYRAAEAAATNTSQLEILKQAAAIEKDRNSGIEARLALLRAENEIELQKAAVNYGSSSPQYRQLQQLEAVEEAKLRFARMDEQIAQTEKANETQVKEIQDEALRGLLQKRQAQQEINQLNKAEAELLREILPMYQEQAALVGGEANQKVQDVQKQIGDLSTPTKKNTPGGNIGDELSNSVTSSLEHLASAAAKGKASFKDMADSIISDIERIALKSLEDQFLTPFFNSLFGSGGGGGGGFLSGLLPGHAKGGKIDGPSIVGEEGPELEIPDSPGTIIPNDVLKSLGGGGGQGTNVGINITNNSSQQLNARETGRSYDHDSRQFIVHTVLEDLHQGGAISGALSGMGR